jgi:DNA-binding transcriptional LysR family regulator
MTRKSARGVRKSEHTLEPIQRTLSDWEPARIFVEVAKQGSFRAASKSLGMSTSAVSAQVAKFEEELEAALLIRETHGTRLTADGRAVFNAALRMEAEAHNLVRARWQREALLAGEVRLTVTEGLGAFWITPRLIEFQRANPSILVNIDAVVQSVDISRLETDVAIQLREPELPDVRRKRLGRLHLVPFASREYLSTYGPAPKTLEEVRQKHRVVLQSGNDEEARTLYDSIFPGPPAAGTIAFRTNVGGILYGAILKGAGIGLLPTYAYAIGADIVPLDLPVHLEVDIWLSYHAEVKRTPRVNALIGWIVHSFDPRRFPWFRDEFIQPRDLQKAYKGEPLTTLFAGFQGRR